MNARLSLTMVVVLTLTFAGQSLPAETLTEDTVWSGDVPVAEDLDVAADATLTLNAGTRLLIAAGVSLRIHGRLLADGTESEPVYFTRSAPDVQWERLYFLDAEDSRLSHCVFEYSDSEGDHKDYYDDRDSECEPTTDRAPRDYNETIVVIASSVEFDTCTFQNLPSDSGSKEGDAIAIISDDPEVPGDSTAHIHDCEFLSIGQGIHTRYSYVLVEDCFFTDHNGDNDDVDLFGESDPPPLILNNLFIDPADDDMINPTQCSAILVGNVIAGSRDHGIVLRDRCDPVLINNTIYDCSSAGIAVQNSCDALLVNNTIYDCGRGVRFFDHTGRWGRPYCLQPGSGRATLINTIIWNCPTALELQDSPYEIEPGSHVTLLHSNVEGRETRTSISANSTITWGEGNIEVDPLFVDAEAGDFRLQATSMLIDAGTSDSAPDTDMGGNARPCGEGIDIGAWEFGDCEPSTGPRFRRGDVNGDGQDDISDAVKLLFFLFLEHEIGCESSADVNDDGDLELGDVLYLLNYLFTLGDEPPAPGLSCGSDPTADALPCEAPGEC